MGELYLGGANVARGYLNQAHKSAEVFITDPFSSTFPSGQAKMYRTGDLVKRQPNGELEFIGRIDNQIKIRGFRIEPEEIETKLSAHSGVSEAVVFLDSGNIEDLNDISLLSALSKLPLNEVNALLDKVEQLAQAEIKEENHHA